MLEASKSKTFRVFNGMHSCLNPSEFNNICKTSQKIDNERVHFSTVFNQIFCFLSCQHTKSDFSIEH